MARPGQERVPPGLERDLLERVLHAARLHVRGYMNATGVSETLSLSLDSEVSSDFFNATVAGKLILPYYWAEFVHNGRGDAYAKGSKFMIFFPNKRDDPRTAGGINYPKELGSRRSLSRAEILRFREINKQRRKDKQPLIMVYATKVRPGQQAPPGKQFYVNAMRIFPPVRSVEERLAEVVKKIAPNGTRRVTIRLA